MGKGKDEIKDELDELEGSTDLQDRASDSLDGSEDEIDAFIKKHLENEEEAKKSDIAKAKEMLA